MSGKYEVHIETGGQVSLICRDYRDESVLVRRFASVRAFESEVHSSDVWDAYNKARPSRLSFDMLRDHVFTQSPAPVDGGDVL